MRPRSDQEPRRTRGNGRGRRRLAASLSCAAIVAGTLGAVPAQATPGPDGIAPGINITIFHNIDFVATFGWPVGEQLTVEVFRNGVLIGSAVGETVDGGPDGGAMEVNHGPAGAPVPGDCFDGHTPDIRPGDMVQVSGNGTINNIIVDDLGYSGPAEETVDGTIEVRGWARTAAGAAIPVASLDSAEFRDGQLRGVPSEVVADTAVGAPVGGFIMRYAPDWVPDRNSGNVSPSGIRTSLLTTGGHAIGFGHVAPLPDEAQLIDGIDDTPGPALGCEASPSAQHAVTQIGTTKPGYLNAADLAGAGDVTFSGVSFAASAVEVNVGGVIGDATITGPAGGSQSWTAAIPKSALAAVADGNLTAAMTSTTGTGDVAGISKTVIKDATAPVAPQVTATDPASPNPSLAPKVKGMAAATATDVAEDTSTVSLYDNSTCAGVALATGTGEAFRTVGLPTTVGDASTTTFHARTVDVAGNPSACSTTGLVYVQDAVAPPKPTLGEGSTTGVVESAEATFLFSNTEPGVTFQCALDGATPSACSSPVSYTGLAEGSHSLSIEAKDAAGNISDALLAPWVVDMTAPGAPTMEPGAPSGLVSSRQATFSFGHEEPGVTFTCSLDGAIAESCVSPVTYTGLSQGKHSVSIVAQDAAGHLSPAQVARWTVDTKGPKVTDRNPAQNAENVKVGKTLKVTLNEKVTGATARNVKVFAAGSNKATKAVVRYNASKSIIKINPRTVLNSGTRYSVVLGRGIKDLAGNRLKPTIWRFTT